MTVISTPAADPTPDDTMTSEARTTRNLPPTTRYGTAAPQAPR